jgi:hypothetical protein
MAHTRTISTFTCPECGSPSLKGGRIVGASASSNGAYKDIIQCNECGGATFISPAMDELSDENRDH